MYQKRLFVISIFGLFPKSNYNMLYFFVFNFFCYRLFSHFVTDSVHTASVSFSPYHTLKGRQYSIIYCTVKAILQVCPPNVNGNVAVPAAPGVPVMLYVRLPAPFANVPEAKVAVNPVTPVDAMPVPVV